jgi:hypothetical protein
MKLALFAGLLAAGAALAKPWTPEPWLADLEQMRQALDTKYANRDPIVALFAFSAQQTLLELGIRRRLAEPD